MGGFLGPRGFFSGRFLAPNVGVFSNQWRFFAIAFFALKRGWVLANSGCFSVSVLGPKHECFLVPYAVFPLEIVPQKVVVFYQDITAFFVLFFWIVPPKPGI